MDRGHPRSRNDRRRMRDWIVDLSRRGLDSCAEGYREACGRGTHTTPRCSTGTLTRTVAGTAEGGARLLLESKDPRRPASRGTERSSQRRSALGARHHDEMELVAGRGRQAIARVSEVSTERAHAVSVSRRARSAGLRSSLAAEPPALWNNRDRKRDWSDLSSGTALEGGGCFGAHEGEHSGGGTVKRFPRSNTARRAATRTADPLAPSSRGRSRRIRAPPWRPARSARDAREATALR